MYNNNYETQLIGSHEEQIREDAEEQESFEGVNENKISEE